MDKDTLASDAPQLRRRLLEHYDRMRRDLPWRGEPDPYRIWVSEVMLQQTRVEAVVPYYLRWMERFPDLTALAAADEDEVLGLWEGLGYYSRARNLHRAVRVVRDRLGGRVPHEAAELLRLPGVGSYTAGAVASIAFGAVEPAVDGNVRRVLSRLYDLADPSGAELTARAAGLVDPERPGDFNQALMDLGATVCTPRSPGCSGCPLRTLCRAHARGTVAERPTRRKRPARPHRRFALAVLADAQRRVLFVRRPREGLLGGLWAFPEAEIARPEDASAAAREVARTLGFDCAPTCAELAAVRHLFTHLEAHYHPVLLYAAPPGREEDGKHADDGESRWADPLTREGLALPTAQKRVALDVVRTLALP